jgi:hypothetical protein
MSNEKHEINPETRFERRDLSAGGIISFLIGLALFGVLVYFVLKNPLVVEQKTQTREVAPQDTEKFPQPRLETSERTELNSFRRQEEDTLNTYGWVDQKAGAVRIPIDRAMQLIVQRGLPVRGQAAAAPQMKAARITPEAGRVVAGNRGMPRERQSRAQ